MQKSHVIARDRALVYIVVASVVWEQGVFLWCIIYSNFFHIVPLFDLLWWDNMWRDLSFSLSGVSVNVQDLAPSCAGSLFGMMKTKLWNNVVVFWKIENESLHNALYTWHNLWCFIFTTSEKVFVQFDMLLKWKCVLSVLQVSWIRVELSQVRWTGIESLFAELTLFVWPFINYPA